MASVRVRRARERVAQGMNEIALEFAHTSYAKNDPRPLAVLFDAITIREPWFQFDAIPPLRMPADRIVGASAAESGRRSTPDLLLRLGFDPTIDVGLFDAARTVAWGPDCIDDHTFLLRAFAILLERGPNPIEERDLMERLRRGTPRDAIVKRILQGIPSS